QRGGGGRRRGADDEIGHRQRGTGALALVARRRRVERVEGVSLRREESSEPATHAPGAADDDGALAGADRGGAHALFFLRRERRANETGEQVGGDTRVEALLRGAGARPVDHHLLLLVVHGR